MKANRYLYSDRIVVSQPTNKNEMLEEEYNILKELCGLGENNNLTFEYDIPGSISKKTLQHIIKNKYILPQNSYLNKTKMDAENYYLQTGDLIHIDRLIERIK